MKIRSCQGEVTIERGGRLKKEVKKVNMVDALFNIHNSPHLNT
jgi:hypothetical protein